MPELPEIETLRHDLEREVGGKRIRSVELHSAKVVHHHANRKQFIGLVEGAKFKAVRRKAGVLLIPLDNDYVLVIDLRNGGRLRRASAREAMEPKTQAVFTFTQGGHLRLIDPADGAAQMAVVPVDEVDTAFPELAELGVDPVAEPISWVVFGDLLRAHHLKLKQFLTDQTIVAGLGPVYSDEILYEAGLRPDRWSNELSAQEVRRLYRAVVEAMHEGIKHRGVTLGDDGFTDLAGRPGGFTDMLHVYRRDGLACLRCRSVISKKKMAGTTVYMCLECQV